MSTLKSTVLLIALFCLSFLGQDVLAQQNNLARIYFVTPVPGHGTELEAAIKEHAQWRKQEGDPWTWTVHQVVNGDNLGDFVIRSGGHSWADFDAYDAGFGPKGNAHWFEHVVPHIHQTTSAITEVDMDHMLWPENPEDVNLLSVTTFYLNPGGGQALSQVVEKAHKAFVEHDRAVHYGWEWHVNGAAGQAVNLVIPHRSWADFGGPEEELGAFLVRTMGEESAMKMRQAFDGSYHTTKSWVVRVRPDLSVWPEM